VRLFIAFRVFFNARFYYPVFTILFIDFGLSMAQFALLNAVWAASIVLWEVPSGALADVLGRRRLLIGAGLIMVLEIGLLCFAPRGNPGLLFGLFFINRLLSGTAEASASGADEALAYDTLKRNGQEDQWPRVLEVQVRLRSIAFVVTMSLGAAIYDPALMQSLADLLGLKLILTQEVTLRFPLFLTLVMALITLAITVAFQPAPNISASPDDQDYKRRPGAAQVFSLTLSAGRWILVTPMALLVILAGLLFDSVARMVTTLASQYYRMIQLPEASFGLIGSLMALMGLIIPRIARYLVENHSPQYNFTVVAVIVTIGAGGMTFFWPYVGLLPAMILFSSMYFNGFFMSHYLNQMTASDRRATVLSFKGLSFNLAYGLAGIGYSLILTFLRQHPSINPQELSGSALENLVFVKSFIVFPASFALGIVFFVIYARRKMKTVSE
jgi:MFS family permease